MAASKYDIELDVSHPSNTSHWHVADLVGSAKRVLDVGCSTGYLAEALAGRGNEVLGVEYDDASAELARSRGLQVLTADLESVDLAEHFGPRPSTRSSTPTSWSTCETPCPCSARPFSCCARRASW